MRELKFRAFNKKEKKICKVVSTDFKHLVTIRFPEFDGLIGDFDDQMELIEFEPLMQFTGLKDKNGVEIYEGDVISISDREDGYQAIYYEEGMYCTDEFALFELIRDASRTFEIKGNIYENPELLEESK